MCFKTKISTPKTKAADIVAPPEPLKDAPSGVQWGGSDEDDESKVGSEVSGVSSLKVKTVSSKASGPSSKSISGTAKRAVQGAITQKAT